MKKLLFVCSYFVLFKAAGAQSIDAVKSSKPGADSNYAVLYIYRPGGGNDRPNSGVYIITANGKEVATVKYGTKQAIKIPAGDSVLLSTTKKTKEPLKLILKEGKGYYIRCFYHMDYFWGGPQLVLMPEDRGEFEYNNYENIIAAQKEREKSDRKRSKEKDDVYQ